MKAGQQDRHLGMMVHALVLASGLVSLPSGGTWIGLVPAAANVYIYLTLGSKSRFVARHARQAAGWQIGLFLIGLIIGLLLPFVAAAALRRQDVGAAMALLWVLQFIGTGLGLGTLVVGGMGLMKAHDGEEYAYPVLGKWIGGFRV